MNPARRQKLTLILIAVGLFSVAVILLLFANRHHVNLFFSPTEIAEGLAPVDQPIRAGGMVVVDSVRRDSDTLAVSFQVTDFLSEITMSYVGILPDLFREGQGVVVMGSVDAEGIFRATEVLARHDENYMPPEVAAALEAAGHQLPTRPADY